MLGLITVCLLGVPLEHRIMYILNSIDPQASAQVSQLSVIRQRFTPILFALPLLARTLHLRSSVQAQLPTERAPFSSQRCLVNPKARCGKTACLPFSPVPVCQGSARPDTA